MLRDVRSGQSRVLVVHGEPGVGKSALMEYLAGQASGCRLIRAAGVESEMELACAALQQLCLPMLDRLEQHALPAAPPHSCDLAGVDLRDPAPQRASESAKAADPRAGWLAS